MVMDKKTIRRITDAALAQGWRVEDTRKGRMFYPADRTKSPVLIHFTDSDHRAEKNAIAQLRRSGLIWPTK